MLDDDDITAPSLRPPLANTSAPRDLEPSASDLDILLKWQQQRQQRRLAGEYESSMSRLSELVTGNLKAPIRIREVRVLGAPCTRPSFLSYIINPILSSPDSAEDNTLEAALHTTRRVADILIRTDIFSSVNPTLERSYHPLAQEKDVNLVVRCQEKSRFFMKTATEIGNNEGTASMTGRSRNVFGGGEHFEAAISYGSHIKQTFTASLSTPLSPNLRTTGILSVYGTERDLSSYASCREGLKGIRAAIRSPSQFGSHEFAYEAVLRHLSDFNSGASVSIREAAGFSTKSALSHVYIRDTRDVPAAPTKGSYFKLLQELAGIGGDAQFFKTEVDSQMARDIGAGQTLCLSARSGLLYPLGPSRETLFNDRFQLGGPFSLRSFKSNSMGPRDGNDSLGGDVYWAAGASLIGNLPRKPHWPLKTHLFVNIGRLDSMECSAGLRDTIRSSVSQPSISAGVGLMYHLSPIRVELNFAVPLVAARSDGLQRGFQAGIGIDFL
ncbi:surface antigen-domain-containing protein [Hysterangium stoloniferum]|nr:surface antigen-domain-containing protein [Hysterangium stoloniferum]